MQEMDFIILEENPLQKNKEKSEKHKETTKK